MTSETKRPLWAAIVAIIAVVFGAVTLFSGGRVLFGGEAARAAAGDYVPFVLWFNFFSGFFYILAGVGLFLWRRWAAPLAGLIALGLIVTFAAFGWHIAQGGAYEMRTVIAMSVRSIFWLVIALFVWNGLAPASRV
jgi:uncharacterized membrane protein